jgi:hypothetical protein
VCEAILRGFFVLSLVGLSLFASAQTVPVAKAVLLDKVPTIDGNLGAGEWDQAFHITPFRDRVTEKLSKDQTEAWIGYTKDAIYAAYYCRDTEPDRIVGREIIPNSEFVGEDFVLFSINPFGNRSFDSMSRFQVNVLGTQTENIAGGRTSKREWRGEWRAKTSRVADGWICEMEIPWKMLNYPDQGRLNMDMNFVRSQGRTLFEQSWANVRQNPLPELQGIWEGVEPPKPPKSKIQYLGYSAPEYEKGKLRNRAGLDARYAFSPSFNGLASVNPDFRNIEDVIAGNDFVRTERFLDDRRPFFNEGGDFFNLTDRFGYGRMFYSRRIGEFDVGAKAYGQYTPNLGVGALVSSNFNGEKSAVLNMNRTISAKEAYNVFGTYKAGGEENHSLGFEYFKRVGLIGFSAGAAMEKTTGTLTDTAGQLAVSYEGQNSFAIARYQWVTPNFNPALGFIPWTDRRGGYFYGNKEFQLRTGPLRSVFFEGSVNEFNTYAGVGQEVGWDAQMSVTTRKDMQFGYSRARYRYAGALDQTTSYWMGFNVTNRFKQLNLSLTEGIQNNKPSRFYSVDTSYRVVNNLDVTFRRSVLELDGTSGQSIFTAAYQASPLDLVTSRVVWTGDGTNAYLSYRRTGSTGTDLYLIFGDPNAPKTTGRVALKAVWAF